MAGSVYGRVYRVCGGTWIVVKEGSKYWLDDWDWTYKMVKYGKITFAISDI